ncbi:lysozyme [Serratia phage vB_SlqS_ZDD2]|nr:lysozyme [Serratia phage vB_SlqS_ZDD2]
MNRNNRKAFEDMLGFSEGTIGIPGSDGGYKVVVGETLFQSYQDHPRKKVFIKRINDYSTAAGKYQILERYYDHYKKQLGLKDFSPASQDAIAWQLIRECKAVDDIDAGRIEAAIVKCKSRWASLPGAGYGQQEHSMRRLIDAYLAYGGTVGGSND